MPLDAVDLGLGDLDQHGRLPDPVATCLVELRPELFWRRSSYLAWSPAATRFRFKRFRLGKAPCEPISYLLRMRLDHPE
jgi:hypothetical protein